MKITNYEEFIKYLKALKTETEQINFIMKYFADKVEFDYVLVEGLKVPYSLGYEIDEKFDCSNKEDVEKALMYAKQKGLSNALIERISNIYGKQFTIPAKPAMFSHPAQPEKISYQTFGSTLNMIKVQPTYKNGLITKGVCADYVEFIQQVCNELGIKYDTISGKTTVGHSWIKINGLYYDPTYAIYVRDKYMDWDTKTSIDDWFGFNNDEMFKMHPTRVINKINRVHLDIPITSSNYKSLTHS